ncbi:hypothetical protein [Streptomyces sp. NPDC047108]|uniref:hypothetical protein n=1 Tax=Streptomyces sp. NPDC047108 TaxID=3155025 RepID=UPI0033FE0A1E
MMTNGKIAVALVGGYLLGRTKKAKVALGLGMFLAGKKLSLDPQQLGKLLANSPALSGLSNQARKQLVDATKSAATTALTNRANSLAESLHDRTLSLRDGGPDRDAADEAPADDDTEYEDEDAGREDDRGSARKKTQRAERDEEPRGDQRSTPRRKAAAASRPRKSTASSTARKTASGGARKTASGARKTASGTPKKAAKSRGSRNE